MNKELNKDKIIAYIKYNEVVKEKTLSSLPVKVSSQLGVDIYRETLIFLFVTAVNNTLLHKDIPLIKGAIGDGYFFVFKNGYKLTNKDITLIEKEMDRLVETDAQIERVRLSYSDAIKITSENNLEMSKQLILSLSSPYTDFYKCKDTYRINTLPLLYSFKEITSFALKKYKEGVLLRFPRRYSDFKLETEWKDNPILYKAIKDSNKENDTLLIKSIGELNTIVANGNIKEYIEVSETVQNRHIVKIAENIFDNKTKKIVFIAGPSSSNKTTFANKLCIELKSLGIEPIQISLDDYYFTKDKVPLDEFGEPDLECIEAIDTKLFSNNLKSLLKKEEVKLPRFEFNYNKIGRRTFDSNAIKLKENNVLVVEGIHALNKKLLSDDITQESIYKIYISPLINLNLDEYTRIRSTDIRVLRRLVRDKKYRKASADETLSMWGSVERGERKYIFPYQNDTDVIINSAHSYEIGVLLTQAIPLLRSVEPDDNKEYYYVANKLLKLLSIINPISESFVPENSMLHEFIG